MRELIDGIHIIVCGHTYCGAMKAVLDPGSLDSLPATKGWLISPPDSSRASADGALHALVRVRVRCRCGRI